MRPPNSFHLGPAPNLIPKVSRLRINMTLITFLLFVKSVYLKISHTKDLQSWAIHRALTSVLKNVTGTPRALQDAPML